MKMIISFFYYLLVSIYRFSSPHFHLCPFHPALSSILFPKLFQELVSSERPFNTVSTTTHSPPDTILDVLNFPKNCTNNSIILTYFHKILNSLPKSLLCYTDGSRIHNHIGIAYAVDNTIYSFRLGNSASIFTAEHLVIFHCLENILSAPLPQSPFIVIITDSLSAVHTIADRISPPQL